jgi:adenine deaminase
MNDISRLLAVARGDTPADLLLAGGRIVNVFSGEIEPADVAIFGSQMAGIGPGYHAKNTIDLKGSFIAPGLIDAHVHIESSLCTPAQFAAAAVPRGITTAVIDPHEIANVAGPDGVRFMHHASQNLPLNVVIMAASCVPATPLSTGGGTIDVDDLESLRTEGIIHGLAEVMNYPAIIAGDPAMLAKIDALTGRPIDGHCPGVAGKSLNAYAAAGITSDHECTTTQEAKEKLAHGLYLFIREATNAKNLDTLLPVITPRNSRRICFCSDDRTAGDLLAKGSVDDMIRRAIAFGIDPIEAIRMATLNTAERFGLSHIGAIAPGRCADLIVFDDLKRPAPKMVFSDGKLVARDGQLLEPLNTKPDTPLGHCNIDWSGVSFNVPSRGPRIRVVGARPDQLVTDHRILDAKTNANSTISNPQSDILKMAVIERHHGTGKMALGFIQGFGIKRGAIAGTVAHDHHNLITIGVDDYSMMTASRAASENGGGLAVAVGEHVVARLPLPIAGLMSDQPVAEVAIQYSNLLTNARELGSTLADPFMAMSFMALEVIPSLKLTDHGLIDVEKFKIVDLFV